MRQTLTAALFALPFLAGAALAVGDDDSPPKPTETSTECPDGYVFDKEKDGCVKSASLDLDDDQRYQAVRELAYAGRYDDAQGVLRAMADQSDDRVLTYWGFTHRKMGNAVLAQAFYEKAIAANPDNILARSYMGQGFVESGDMDAAIAQWREIKARGGEGSWAEAALREAIRSGTTYSY